MLRKEYTHRRDEKTMFACFPDSGTVANCFSVADGCSDNTSRWAHDGHSLFTGKVQAHEYLRFARWKGIM